MTDDKPLVSIVLTSYNGEKYIQAQLESLLAQTYSPIEIIAVDDDSKDKTLEILQAYAAKCPFLTVYNNESNLGYLKNFEKGCKLSTGAYISFCDQDDYWHADKIKLLMEALGNYSMIHCDSVLCDQHLKDTGVRISDRVVYQPINNCLQQAVFCRIYGHATLFTRTLLEKAYPFPEVIPHDWWLCYLATLHNGINYLNEPLVYYRQHETNVFGAIGNKRKKKENREKLLQKKREEIDKIRIRMQLFYAYCPDYLRKEKKVLAALLKSYSSFSLVNNFSRMFLFFKYAKLFLSVKKRSVLRNYLFCLKMFAMVK
jgi:glycosyltransferase involved in cell wall biosynthesis